MKIIDLLNKIANGEIKLGTKFNWHYKLYDIELIFTKRQGALGLYFQREDRLIGLFERFNYQILNDEVEILEEQKKIPNEININLAYIDKEYLLDKKDIDKKINEIINRHNILVDKVSDYFKSKETLEKQKKIPEKLPYYSLEKIQKAKNKDEWREERISLLEKRGEDLHIKINSLIDYLKSKGE